MHRLGACLSRPSFPWKQRDGGQGVSERMEILGHFDFVHLAKSKTHLCLPSLWLVCVPFFGVFCGFGFCCDFLCGFLCFNGFLFAVLKTHNVAVSIA
jgi:hypothetical protein